VKVAERLEFKFHLFYFLWSGLVDDVRTYWGENGSKFAISDLMSEKY